MTTERIDIRIREDGARVVRRDIESIAPSADKAASAVDLLKRALAGIGGALAAREILRMADAYTNLQNRLRAAGLEGDLLTTVYEKLRQSANSTRSSLEATVELYSRLAVSAKELGVSQQDLISFTNSLNQAVSLSGATMAEAENAIRQLSQGMASGTLRGEELNSVLEQLPIAADVIAKGLGVTRGQLRKLGEDGKITSVSILNAFKNAREELEGRFANSVPTMGQAFQVLKNNVLDFVGRADAAAGISQKISAALMALARNVDNVADAIKRLVQTLAVAITTYAAFQAALRVGAIVEAARAALEYSRAVAAGNVVTLGSIQAERMRATHIAATAAAQTAATAAQAAATAAANAEQLRSAAVTVQAQALQATSARAAIETLRQSTLAKLAASQADIRSAKTTIAAAESAGALSFALATKRTALVQLTAAEASHAALLKQLTALDTRRAAAVAVQTEALAAQTAAQQALNGAQAQAAATAGAAGAANAQAAAAAQAARNAQAAAGVSVLSQAMDKLKAAAGAAWAAIARLFTLVNAHPFVALVTAIVATVGALLVFGDKLNSGIDSATTMADVLQALGESGREALGTLANLASDVFGGLADLAASAFTSITGLTTDAVGDWLKQYTGFYSDVGTGFAGLVRGIAKTIDAIAGLLTGMGIAIVRVFQGLPDAVGEIFKRLYNTAVSTVEDMLNTIVAGINRVRDTVGLSLIESVQLTKLQVDEQYFEKYGQSISNSISDGFEAQGGYMLKAVNGVFDRAAELSAKRLDEQRLLGKKMQADLETRPVAPKSPVDTKELDKLKRAYESLLGTLSPVDAAVIEQAKAFETLRRAQASGLITMEQHAHLLSQARLYFKEQIDPMSGVNRQLDEQDKLLRMTAEARSIEAQVMRIQQDMQRAGKGLTEEETIALRSKLYAIQDLERVTAAQDQLLQNSVTKRKEFLAQLEAIRKLGANAASGFTGGDAAQATNGLLQNAGIDTSGTSVANEAILESYRQMYAQIDEMRKADLISQQDAEMLRAKVAVQSNEQRLQNTQSFFGNLAQLSKSGNKKIAAIGKAAAVAQATIDGILAVQKALASAPPPINYVLAAAVGAASAANIANILSTKDGFKSGGYTGDGGRSEVAGIVHGQEFVVNAMGTSRNRDVLEAINRGERAVLDHSANATQYSSPIEMSRPVTMAAPAVGGGSGIEMKISVNNYAPGVKHEVEQISEDEIRVIARQEVERNTSKVLESELSNPNSRVSKSMRDNFQVERVR